jgi:hypothetical protein
MDLKKAVAEIAEDIEDVTVDLDTLGPEHAHLIEANLARMTAEDARIAQMGDEALAALQRFDEPTNHRWCALADAIGKLLADDPNIVDEDALMTYAELIGTRILVRAVTRRRAN